MKRKHFTRRDFLKACAGVGGVGLLTPYQLIDSAAAARSEPFRIFTGALPSEVFGSSVASGDPTPSGVILWTRVNPEMWQPNTWLAFQVARDDRFDDVVAQGLISSDEFDANRDYTVKIDLDGQLESNRFFYYRFIYRLTPSRTGRCRTLPAADAELSQLRLGLLTCQDYTNGFYGAFGYLAREELDFVLHMGDFIYETAADPAFQNPVPGREIILPSGGTVCLDLTDYRFMYNTYRSDRFLQQAMEAHTFIVIWDDHEYANDAYYDYEKGAPAAPDHPFVDDPDALTQLKLDAMRAWAEWVPARLQINEDSTDPLTFYEIYRSFRFGNLAELFMTDERSYRSAPPCGVDERYGSLGCDAIDDPTRTMLGSEQRQWLTDGITNSTAQWKLWGNEVMQMPLLIRSTRREDLQIYVNLDAWDGYEAERQALYQTFANEGVSNLVVLTGDLHTYLAGYLKLDYSLEADKTDNVVGVEFMTPAVTSANLAQQLENLVGQPVPLPGELDERVVTRFNPHICFFNSQDWGYSTLTVTPDHVLYTAYAVNKDFDSRLVPRKVLTQLKVDTGSNIIEELDGSAD